MKITKLTDADRWEEFVRENNGPVFDSWTWGKLCEECGHRTYFWGVEEDGELLACLPLVYMRSRLFGDQLVSMPYSAYGSVVSAPDAPEEAVHLLLEPVRDLADELDVDLVSLRGRDLGDPPGFERAERFVTFDIPLTGDPEDAWDALDGSTRNHVRKAEKNGVEYRRATSKADLRRYYDLYLKNMRAFGSPPYSFSFFTYLWEELGEGMVVELALKDDHLINGQIRFPYGDRCFDWGGVSDYEYRDLQGGSFLLWNAIERACEAGYGTYTLGRTREGTGVYSFKKSWGGQKVRFADYHYSPNGSIDLPDPDDEKYDRLKDVWERLPLKVTELVGPPIRRDISL
ncbi:lipid II:glycine glycyltransferase FemX [Halalkalicoccus jeotgali]|uniref:FemAB-like protein, PEP-CTERM system-associated n=1 Tax=Halalkalicoccus jeotgali (strain DSM 18796 / CECT 7217 / JCM 14584 / KCTC 4019 / B3) TaxID=795797 RepID=D8J7I0_HALJB|nr:GNAT family N-acetyltransferase [Halalkalicoccus jeotgali]ADJ14075.1 FemAB-related protein, PEP-CTERM system-associated [Halalkalicoccus jeotgali B3]ELY33881.1 FemAB-like protein, PEP-CTERM system-associated [Halalkalicoccus jeotgali B3]